MVALRDIDVDLLVMEHDNPNDMTRFAKRSIETIRKL
jgi:sugar phosphate isomerase/epimerase